MERDRTMDLLRALSIGVVVFGHWLMAIVVFEHGTFSGSNALDVLPGLWALTWLLQVMPLFFFVGGFTNLRGWRSARERGVGVGGFLAARLARLLRPTVLFAGIGTAVWVLLGRLLPGSDLALAGEMLAKPLWFLAVYLLVIALTPVMAAAHTRAPLATLAGLALAAGCVDAVRLGAGIEAIGYLNFAFVWLFAHQLGFLYLDGTYARAGRRVHAAMAVLGLGTVAILTNIGVYAPSLVGTSSDLATNNSPASVVLVAHSVWLTGLFLLLKPAADRWLRRERVWRAVIVANVMAMTVFLWHLTAMAIGAAVLLPLGFPQPEAGTTAWWLLRPVWLAALTAILVPMVLLLSKAERVPMRRGGPARAVPAFASAGASLVGLASLAGNGFTLGGAGALGAGYLLLRRARAA